MKRVTHRHPMPTSHKKEIISLVFAFAVISAILRYALNWVDDTGALITIIIGLLLGFAVFMAGAVRRKNTTLVAEVNEDSGRIAVWMKKTIPAWKGRLDPLTNYMNIQDADNAFVQELNQQKTLVLKATESNKLVYIPQRIAFNPEVTKFLMNFVDSKEAKKLDKESKTKIKEFLTK